MGPIRVTTVEADVARVRSVIAELQRRNETRLPPEPLLAEQLDITRSRVRTVLRSLEREGTIWRHVGKGTFVGRRDEVVDFGAIESSVSPEHLIEARLAVEPSVAALAAVRATPAQLAEMQRCLDDMSHQAEYTEWKRLDDELHRILARAAGNPLFLAMVTAIQSMANSNLDERSKAVFGPARWDSVNEEHRAFIDAIRQRDAANAEGLMREHITSVGRSLLGRFK
jgi:DNA-binding FadR family transcriptional regulator